MKKGIVITLILMLVLAVSLMAQAPDSFVYQGRLTDPDGTPITATTAVTFRLYSDPTAGTLLHTWGGVSVTPDANGVFTAELTTLDRSDFSAGNKLYMAISIGDQTLLPRQLITSVPYAYSSGYAGTATTVVDNSITSAKIVNSTITGSDVSDASLTGADIENSSITAADILDEPGIAYEINNGSVTLVTAEMTDIATISITVPAAGYIDVEGACFVMFSGTTGANQAIFQIDQTAGGSYIAIHETRAGLDEYAISTDNVFPVYVTRLYNVAAGAYTFRFEGMAQNGSPASALAWYGKIKATYFPKNYGTVETAPEDNNDNPDQSFNSGIDPNTGLTVESMQIGTQEK